MRIIYLIFAIALFTGCRQRPTALGHQIADADHIVARHYLVAQRRDRVPPEMLNFSVTITGDDVHTIVNAISGSSKEGWESVCNPTWELQFYKGSNWLANVDFGCELVYVDGAQFEDHTGTLEKLERAIEAQTHRIPMPTVGTIGPLSNY